MANFQGVPDIPLLQLIKEFRRTAEQFMISQHKREDVKEMTAVHMVLMVLIIFSA